MHADMRNDGDSFGKEEIVEGGEVGVKTSAKEFVYVDEVGEEDV